MEKRLLSFLILLTGVTFCNSIVYSPLEYSVNYIESGVNISWDKTNFNSLTNVNILLLHNDYISQYSNGTQILNNNVPNNGYYNWIPEYDLNKYILNDMDFKILVSSSNDPFSTTLGETITNNFGNNFILKSNVNITRPHPGTVLFSNDVLNIDINGFKNNIFAKLFYDNGSNILLEEFYIQNTREILYNVSNNIQYFNTYPIYLELIESETNILRTVPNLKAAGINIDDINIDVYGNETFNITWKNNNFNSDNIIEIKEYDNILFNDTINNTYFFSSLEDLNISISNITNYTSYIFNVFSNDMKLSSSINIRGYNYLIKKNLVDPTLPPDINTSNEDQSLFVLIAFLIFVLLIGLLYWFCYGKEHRRKNSVYPKLNNRNIEVKIAGNNTTPTISGPMINSLASTITDSHNHQNNHNDQNNYNDQNNKNTYQEPYNQSSRNIYNNAMYGEPDDYPISKNNQQNIRNTYRKESHLKYNTREKKSRTRSRARSLNIDETRDSGVYESRYNHIDKYERKKGSISYNYLDRESQNNYLDYQNNEDYEPKYVYPQEQKNLVTSETTSNKKRSRNRSGIQLTSPLYSELDHVGDNRVILNGYYQYSN